MTNNIVDEIGALAAGLPLEQQQTVLELVKLLATQGSTSPRRSVFGDLEHLGVSVTAQDIEEARGEMWGSYMGNDE